MRFSKISRKNKKKIIEQELKAQTGISSPHQLSIHNTAISA
jgi:hypothetical protein